MNFVYFFRPLDQPLATHSLDVSIPLQYGDAVAGKRYNAIDCVCSPETLTFALGMINGINGTVEHLVTFQRAGPVHAVHLPSQTHVRRADRTRPDVFYDTDLYKKKPKNKKRMRQSNDGYGRDANPACQSKCNYRVAYFVVFRTIPIPSRR